jgi:hypothetical protein
VRSIKPFVAAFAAVVLLVLTGGALYAWPVGLFAGATSTTVDLDAAMKIIFDDTLVDSAVTDTEILDLFEESGGIRTDQTTGGRYIELANMFALPAGVGARSEGDYIPVPGGPIIVNGRVSLKKIMGTVEMTAEVMKRVRTSIGSFIDWGESALPKLVERLTNEMDRMAIGYGAGIKARVNAAAPGTNLIVDNALGISWSTIAKDALVQFLEEETLVAGPNANGTALRNSGGTPDKMKVEAVDWDNGYIVVDALATALANNDYLFPGDEASNSAAKEFMGLFGMVDNGSILNIFQNINRTTYKRYQSYVKDATGLVLDEELVTEVDDEAFTRSAAKVDTMVGSRFALRALWKDLKADRSINDPRMYTGGKKGVDLIFGDRTINVRVARKLPERSLFGLTRRTFRKWLLHEWEWDRTTGSMWRQVTDAVGRKDAFYTYGSTYCELGNDEPQKNWRIQSFDMAS